jgi:hypothetical protein
MNGMKRICLLSLLLSLLFVSCKSNKDATPSDVLSKDKMVDVLVDVHLAEASLGLERISGPRLDQLTAKKYDSVFMKHQITYEQFKTSYEYYVEHPVVLDDMYQEVINHLSTMQGKFSSGPTHHKMPKDSLRNIDVAPHH